MIHRDLKPENLLCEDTDDGSIQIKLTDFGFACKVAPGETMDLSLGSPLYMAPELILRKTYDNKVDVWAVGVILYILLTGIPPFIGQNTA
jgi:calcium-dependent protein kinase